LLGYIGAPLGSLVGMVLVSLPGHLRALARHSGITLGQLLQPFLPWCWRAGITLALAAVVALVWAPGNVLGFLVVSTLAVVLYGVAVGPVAFHAPLESYVRPRWNALFGRFFVSKPTGAP
jgi:hypothetical protein